MSTPTAQVRVSLDKAQAERDAESFGQALLGSLTPTIDVAGLVGDALNQVGAALGAVVDYTKEAVIASAAEAAGELRLEQTLRARGLATEGVIAALGNYNYVLQQSTGYADDQLLALEQQLLALGVMPDQLGRATQATIGLAEVGGKGLAEAARAVSKTLGGSTEALKELGVKVSSTSEAMEFLTSRAALAQSNVEGFAGQAKLLSANMGDLQEAIGAPIARSTGVIGALGEMNTIVLGAQAAVAKLGDAAAEAATPSALGALGAAAFALGSTTFPFLTSAVSSTVIELRSLGQEAKGSAQAAKEAADLLAEANFDITRMGREGGTQFDAFGRGFDSQTLREGAEAAKALAKAQAEAAAKAKAEAEAAYRNRLGDYSPDQFVGPRDPERDQMDLSRQQSEREAEFKRLAFERDRELSQSFAETAFQDRLSQYDAEQSLEQALRDEAFSREVADYDRRTAERERFIDNGISLVGQFGSSLAFNLGAAAVSGKSAGDVILTALGGVVSSVGASLVGLGTAALIAGQIPAPWLWPVTGGPGVIPFAAAAIAAGLALSVGGGALSAAGSPSSKATPRLAGGGGRSSPRTEADSQTFGRGSGGDVSTTFVVQVTGGVWGMDSPRALRDMLDETDRLEPRRRFAT